VLLRQFGLPLLDLDPGVVIAVIVRGKVMTIAVNERILRLRTTRNEHQGREEEDVEKEGKWALEASQLHQGQQ
jgi:hypothetical protein